MLTDYDGQPVRQGTEFKMDGTPMIAVAVPTVSCEGCHFDKPGSKWIEFCGTAPNCCPLVGDKVQAFIFRRADDVVSFGP